MGKAFKVDGAVLEKDNKKLLVSIDPAIMSALANWLKACPPVDAQVLQRQIDGIDRQISDLHRTRLELKREISSAWHSSPDKRHRAIQALGHQIWNSLPIFLEGKNPEDFGIEVYDDDESIER